MYTQYSRLFGEWATPFHAIMCSSAVASSSDSVC